LRGEEGSEQKRLQPLVAAQAKDDLMPANKFLGNTTITMKEEALFNLKAVIKKTGLKPDTLRAWERRYGIPTPQRSAGGHRLYSQHDISTIQWLMARQQEGMSIKRAVELWGQIEREGRDPLHTPTPLVFPPAPPVAVQMADGTLSEMRKSWINACLIYDERTAEQILAQAFAIYPLELV
jgi:DNA-binding transcriptional MerR regulator